MQWRLLSRNVKTNTEAWYAEEGDKVYVRQVPVSESPLHQLYKDNDLQREKNIRYGDGAVAARIDPFTMNILRTEGVADDPDAMKKFLNTPSNKHFRTTKGKI